MTNFGFYCCAEHTLVASRANETRFTKTSPSGEWRDRTSKSKSLQAHAPGDNY